jgi:hypothetical protein
MLQISVFHPEDRKLVALKCGYLATELYSVISRVINVIIYTLSVYVFFHIN